MNVGMLPNGARDILWAYYNALEEKNPEKFAIFGSFCEKYIKKEKNNC